MANRVVLGAFGGTYVLRVSRPGFNVLSAGLTPKQLAFDSRWQETGNVFMTGSFSIGGTGTVTINYGATLSPAPIVILRVIGSANAYMVAGAQKLDADSNILKVGNTSFTYNKGNLGGGNSGTLFSGTKAVRYTIYRNLYG